MTLRRWFYVALAVVLLLLLFTTCQAFSREGSTSHAAVRSATVARSKHHVSKKRQRHDREGHKHHTFKRLGRSRRTCYVASNHQDVKLHPEGWLMYALGTHVFYCVRGGRVTSCSMEPDSRVSAWTAWRFQSYISHVVHRYDHRCYTRERARFAICVPLVGNPCFTSEVTVVVQVKPGRKPYFWSDYN